MAGRSPIGIVREYLEPGEPPQVRKNALSALAALHDRESLELLADVAAGDAEAQVRERAEQEVAALEGPDAALALARVSERVRDVATRRQAYVLLGRLRDAGMSVRVPPIPFVSRLLLARSLSHLLHPRRGFRFHFRTVKGLSLGALVGSVVVALYIGRTLGLSGAEWFGVVVGFYALAWLLLLLVGLIAFRYTVPARLQADTAAAAVVDTCMVAMATLALTALAVFADVYQEEHKGYDGFGTLLVAVPAAAVAVRLSTLALFGISPRRWVSHLAQTVGGGLCGIATYDLIAMWGGDTPRLVGLGAIHVLIGAFGLAGAYADLDSRSRPAPVVPPPLRLAAVVGASLAVLIGGLALLPAADAQVSLGTVTQLPRTVDLWHVPATVSYTAGANAEFVIENPLSYDVDVARREGGRTDVRITRRASTDTDEVWSHLAEASKLRTWGQIRARLTGSTPGHGPVMARAIIASRDCDVTRIGSDTTMQDALTSLECSTPLGPRLVRRYAFEGRAGERLEISVQARFDTALALQHADGRLLADADDTNGLNPLVDVTLPDTGTYIIEVRGLGATGMYTLRLR